MDVERVLIEPAFALKRPITHSVMLRRLLVIVKAACRGLVLNNALRWLSVTALRQLFVVLRRWFVVKVFQFAVEVALVRVLRRLLVLQGHRLVRVAVIVYMLRRWFPVEAGRLVVVVVGVRPMLLLLSSLF